MDYFVICSGQIPQIKSDVVGTGFSMRNDAFLSSLENVHLMLFCKKKTLNASLEHMKSNKKVISSTYGMVKTSFHQSLRFSPHPTTATVTTKRLS